MAAFMAAFSHFCNNSTRGALLCVVVLAQPRLFCASTLIVFAGLPPRNFVAISLPTIAWCCIYQLLND
jgi:hypothetical protein